MKTPWKLFISLGTLVGLAAIIKKKALMRVVWDQVSEYRLGKLHPKVREAARKFINAAEAEGIKLRVTHTLRTIAEQDALYAQGRTAPGKIVTNAKGGRSFHNYGLALDVVEIKDGKALWSNPRWNRIGELGKQYGFKWGGDWQSLKDMPHFEMTFGYTTSQLMAKVNSGKVDSQDYVLLV